MGYFGRFPVLARRLKHGSHAPKSEFKSLAPKSKSRLLNRAYHTLLPWGKNLDRKEGIMTIKLGEKVKDSLTGFEGIVVAKAEYLDGCIRFQVLPEKLMKDGKIADPEWLDEGRLIKSKKPGGPQDEPPSRDP